MSDQALRSREPQTCHVCGASVVDLIPEYEQLRRVTSDCKPWRAGGKLGVCRACGCAENVIDEQWQSEAAQIYRDYTIYYQSGGSEQAVFDPSSGAPALRSERLLHRVAAEAGIAETGRMLDVGCGNGGLLQTFSRFRPRWALAGTEFDDKYRSLVERIDGVEALYTGPIGEIPGTFDLATLMHVLEHIPSPRDVLAQIRDKLAEGGLLVVEVPDPEQNPFDLLVADHCSHFPLRLLSELVASAGFEVVAAASDWIPKELTVVGRKSPTAQPRPIASTSAASVQTTAQSLSWLTAFVRAAREAAAPGTFGLFGTSIAGTWLSAELGDVVSFFVDEDPNRVGKTYEGRPIHHPRDVPAGSHVFVGLPTKLAERIRDRLASSRPDVGWHVPPA